MCVCVCARGWVKCRKHISLLVILCIIVYVTNKEKKNIILQNRYSIMVKCLNIGENIGKPIYLPISSHNQMLCDWLTGTPMILNFRQAPPYPPPTPPPPRESKRLSIMPFQTLSTKQSEVEEFGIIRLVLDYTWKRLLFQFLL